LFAMGRYETALPALQRALRRSTSLIGSEPAEAPLLRVQIAWSLYHLGRYQEALSAFLSANEVAPDLSTVHAGIGWGQLKLGRKGEAHAAFRRALNLTPDDKDALEGLRRAGS